MTKPPIIVAHDPQAIRPEDTPEGFLAAIEVELAKAHAGAYPSLDVTADTPDDVLNAFLFDQPKQLEPWREYFLRRVVQQKARAIIQRCAVEMYQERGHTLAEAEKLAATLLDSPVMFRLPEFDDL